MAIELSEAERLILINQYKILSLIDVDEKDNYEESISILRNGYEDEYENLPPKIFPVVSLSICVFVGDVLDVYDKIGKAIEKNALELPEALRLSSQFYGFNEHSENEYLRYAHFLVKIEKTFLRFDKLDLICPGENVSRYNAVVSRWKELSPGEQENLSLKEITLLLQG